MAGLLFNKYKGDSVRVLLVWEIMEMLQALKEIMLQVKQGLLNVTIAQESGQVLDEEQLALICTDKSEITRKQSKIGKHGHENQKSTKRSQRIKAEARKVKPQSNPVKEKSIIGQQKSTRPTIFHFYPQSFTKVQK
ncbi:hypothetical protein Tco_0362747 [Tanacetum coccineum]